MELQIDEIVSILDILTFLGDDEDKLNFLNFGIPRQIYDRTNYFNTLDEVSFQRRFRLSKEAVLFLLNLIEKDLEYPTNR